MWSLARICLAGGLDLPREHCGSCRGLPDLLQPNAITTAHLARPALPGEAPSSLDPQIGRVQRGAKALRGGLLWLRQMRIDTDRELLSHRWMFSRKTPSKNLHLRGAAGKTRRADTAFAEPSALRIRSANTRALARACPRTLLRCTFQAPSSTNLLVSSTEGRRRHEHRWQNPPHSLRPFLTSGVGSRP